MKHYLVMCKDDQQWDEYVYKLSEVVRQSKVSFLDCRDNSCILYDYFYDNLNVSEGAVYYKVTPLTINCQLPYHKLNSDKIWLCEKEEFL